MEDITKGNNWIFGKVDEEFAPEYVSMVPKYPFAHKIVDKLVEYPLNANGFSPVIKLIFDEPKNGKYLKGVRGSAYRYARKFYQNKEKGWRISARSTNDNMGIVFCRVKI